MANLGKPTHTGDSLENIAMVAPNVAGALRGFPTLRQQGFCRRRAPAFAEYTHRVPEHPGYVTSGEFNDRTARSLR
jgi:hypothetical protein